MAGSRAALGSKGGGVEGHAGDRAAPQLQLPHRLARPARGGRARAQAGAAARHGAPRRSARAAQARSGEAGAARRLRRSAPLGVAGGARRNPRRGPALHGRRHARGQGSVFAVRRHACASSEMNAEIGILWPALAAGLLVVATHVPLGIRVLERGIVFIDLAVAQFAALGVVVAVWAGLAPEGAAVQAAALGAALAGALALNWSERLWPEVQEAVIGVAFVLAANAAILVLAANPHGAEHLKELLTGQIL